MALEELRVEVVDEIVYATLGGEIDMSNVQELRDVLGRATTNQALGLVLDLTDVGYLDSAGIHLIHSLRSHLRSHGQQLALIIPDDSVVNDAVRLAGLNWHDSRIGSQEEAAEFFGGGSARLAADEAAN